MSLTDRTKPSDISLNTDLYELTMAQGYWESGLITTEACFTAFFRENPFDGGYAISCGTGQIIDLIKNFIFEDDDITYLASIDSPGGGKLFKSDFLKYLKNHKLNLTIDTIPEGELVFPREPMVRVEGPIIDCQLIETALLNLINFQTLAATKCARVIKAAQGHPVSDFGLRRAQGPDGGLAVARASYIAGATSTSNVLAGKIYNIPVFGTHAHSWVMSFDTELEAFRAFAQSSPTNCTLLLDTYDVHEGIENAVIVAKEMEERGQKLNAIRIDSGDLARLSKEAREAFDEAGLPYVKISVSNDLDEYTIQSLFAQGAPIDSFGVGTKLATCDPQPSLGGVYKLCAHRESSEDAWTPVIKLSEQAYKRTIPGIQYIRRFYDANGCPAGDMIYDPAYEKSKKGASHSTIVDIIDPYSTHKLEGTSRELMVRLVENGQPVGEQESIEVARDRCHAALMHLDAAYTRFLNPQIYPVGLEKGLADLRHELAAQHQVKSSEDSE